MTMSVSDRGRGTDERRFSLVQAGNYTSDNEVVDLLSQARKALCELSPFDDLKKPGYVLTLPSAFAILLNQFESEKKIKKSHFGAVKKKGHDIWIETEEYFRDLALRDIDVLSELSSSFGRILSSKYLLIPYFKNENNEKPDGVDNRDADAFDLLKFSMVMKKLIDEGKVNKEDVATELGVSPDSLILALEGGALLPNIQSKIVEWIKKSVVLGGLHKIPKIQQKPTPLSRSDTGTADHSDNAAISETNITNFVAAKSVPKANEMTSSIHDNLGKSLVANVPKVKDQATSDFPNMNAVLHKLQAFPGFYVHHCTQKRLLDMQRRLSSSENNDKFEEFSKGNEDIGGINSEQLILDTRREVLKLSPEDDIERLILYYQNKLLSNLVVKKHLTDNLICKVAGNLPHEIDAARKQRWDTVFVNQYRNQLMEAEKQSRKGRKHKEAWTVLEAAPSVAASSSRASLFRKDTFKKSSHQKLTTSQKKAVSRVTIPRIPSEKYRHLVHSILDSSNKRTKSCDICGQFETIPNPVFVCSSCKVAVHLDCYRSLKETTGPWYCELCEELSSPNSMFPGGSCSVAKCGLCGGTTGAFRKSTGGDWVHAFCAEWVFELTYIRGQVNSVEGMDTVTKGADVCCVCRRKTGVCIKCSHANCQTSFHPYCARSASFCLSDETSLSGKMQHKAYCEKHSLELRAKPETKKHGAENLKRMKQVRVELERLRLLCKWIVKREKVKRKLVLCSHSILASKRESVAGSVFVPSSFCPDVSSESKPKFLPENTHTYQVSDDAAQISDDATEDSSVDSENQHMFAGSMDEGQNTDHSLTSQKLFTPKPRARVAFPGKPIELGSYIACRNQLDDGKLTSKPTETSEKEMTTNKNKDEHADEPKKRSWTMGN